MKKIISIISKVALVAVLAAFICSPASAAEMKKLVVGVTPFPHAEIMKVAAPLLAEQGYELDIREFNDYVQPNLALADGSLFANFFQHIPYLEVMSREQNLPLKWIARVHIEPMGVYSRKIKSIDELKEGDSVAVPNDPTNGARALRVLETNGLIKLKDGELVTANDITENPKGIKIVELEAAQLPRTLDDVTAAVINTNFAAEAGLNPNRDALAIESSESPYANVLVVRAADADSDAAQALIKAVCSDKVREMIKGELADRGIVVAF